MHCPTCGNSGCFEQVDDAYICCNCGSVIEPEITIPLGQTWQGFEFIRIQRYKRKPGFKISYVTKFWSGKYRSSYDTALTADEVLEKIGRYVILPEEHVERIRQFCGGAAACRL